MINIPVINICCIQSHDQFIHNQAISPSHTLQISARLIHHTRSVATVIQERKIRAKNATNKQISCSHVGQSNPNGCLKEKRFSKFGFKNKGWSTEVVHWPGPWGVSFHFSTELTWKKNSSWQNPFKIVRTLSGWSRHKKIKVIKNGLWLTKKECAFHSNAWKRVA